MEASKTSTILDHNLNCDVNTRAWILRGIAHRAHPCLILGPI